MSLLSSIIGQVESGNNPHASATDAFGNVSQNIQFQQSPGYIQQFGSGEAGIASQAQQLLAANPNATLGDFYAQYNSGGSGGNISIPWSSYVAGGTLSNGVSLAANRNNLTNGAALYGANPNTPLSSLVGQGSNPATEIQGLSIDSNNAGDFIDPNYDYGGQISDSNLSQGGDTITASSFDSGSGLAPGLSGSGTVGFNATTPGASGLGGGSTLFGGDTSGDSVTYANPGSDDIGDFYPDAASGAGSTAGGAVGAVAGAGGAPVDITDLPGLDQSVSGAGKAVQTGAGTIGTDVQQAAGGIAGTAASIFNNAQTYFSGAVAVIALVILGLIFVAFGLGMFKHNLAAAV